jgi:hypothetical protein
LLFLRFWGWIFIGCGVLMVLAGIITLATFVFDGQARRGNEQFFGAIVCVLFGLAVAGAGAWFGIFRGRVVNERCWFCPDGMVWMTERRFEWYSWQDIPEVYAEADAPRPAVGIRFDGPISWITFSAGERSRMIVRYVEHRASAAWLKEALKLLSEGKTIHFGNWDLHRVSLDGDDGSIHWTQIADARVEANELVLRGADGRKSLAIWLNEVPLPSLFTALARALVAHAHERK